MTNDDALYISKLLATRMIRTPVLELGAGYGGTTSRNQIEGAGLEYRTTDVAIGPGVDYVANFEDDDCAARFPQKEFGTVLILNVLEHVFKPINVLDNGIRLARSGGTIVTITPCMWPVHSYPRDYQRLLPDWFVTYCERRTDLRLVEPAFEFLGRGPVARFTRDGERHLPPPTEGAFASLYGKIVHKVFNTSGRSQWAASHLAIGAVFEKL